MTADYLKFPPLSKQQIFDLALTASEFFNHICLPEDLLVSNWLEGLRDDYWYDGKFWFRVVCVFYSCDEGKVKRFLYPPVENSCLEFEKKYKTQIDWVIKLYKLCVSPEDETYDEFYDTLDMIIQESITEN